MTKKVKHKTRAVNDNRPVKRKRKRSQKLRPLKSNSLNPSKPNYSPLVVDTSIRSKSQASLDDTFFSENPYLEKLYEEDDFAGDMNYYGTDDDHAYKNIGARGLLTTEDLIPEGVKSSSQPVFLLVLGFALTCLATLVYVFFANPESNLHGLLIPAIIISTTFLMAMRSSIALWGSLLALTVWSALAVYAKFNGTDIPANNWLIALPIILSLQIIAASHSLSKFVMLASLACAYLWLTIFTLGSELTALASGTLIFILGTAHHRLGKAWDDKGLNYSHEHTLIGWVAAMIGLIWAQHYFIPLGDLYPVTVGVGAHQSFYWLLGIVLGVIAIFFSCLIRLRHNRLSKMACLTVCASSLLLPAVAYAPAIMESGFEMFSGLPAMPYFGFALGAIVLALSVGLGINGLRRRRYIDTVVAGLMICAQTAILTNNYYLTFDTLLVVAFTMLFVICFQVMIARKSILSTPLYLRP